MSDQTKAFRIGLIGTGRFSDIYFKTLGKYPQTDVVACASLNLEESRANAEECGVPRVAFPDDFIADPEIDAIST